MKPIDYYALADTIGLSYEETSAAVRQLKSNNQIYFYPESTEIIRLTQQGVQDGDYWKFRDDHPQLGDPIPDSPEDVRAELAYWSQELSRHLVKSQEFEMISARLRQLEHRERILTLSPPTVYNQINTQHGSGIMNVSQAGNVSVQQLTAGELDELRQALADVRSAFKQQDSIDADEYVGSLASAEKAARAGDEHKMLGFLKQIPERAWDISKVVIPQVLLAYLKAHGYIGG